MIKNGVLYNEWAKEDVIYTAEERGINLTEKEAIDILYYMEHYFDASIGINWDFINHCIDQYLKDVKEGKV